MKRLRAVSLLKTGLLLAGLLLGLLLAGCTPPPLQAERVINQGNEALLEGDLVSAERHYRDALTFQPLPPEAALARASVVYNNLGNTFYRQAEWQDTQDAYERALTSANRQQQAITHYNLGNVFMQRVLMGDQSIAALMQPPTPPSGQAAADPSPEQLTAAAIAHYQDALRRNPDDEDAKYNLELALQQNAQQNQDQQDDQQDQQDEEQDRQDDQQEGQDDQDQQDDQQDEGQNQPEQPEPNEPQEQPAAPPPLTPAQAIQLLEAAAQQSDTLQEYLQRTLPPLPPPEQDW